MSAPTKTPETESARLRHLNELDQQWRILAHTAQPETTQGGAR